MEAIIIHCIQFIILLAFMWLGYETKWLTIRLGYVEFIDWPEILRQRAEANRLTKFAEPYPISHYPIMQTFPLSKAYLIRANKAMRDFEPTIELKLDGKTFYQGNGDYKRGDIRTAVNSQYAYHKGKIKIIVETAH